MERSSRSAGYPWFLTPFLVSGFSALAYPMYVIRPFRRQGPRELAVALATLWVQPYLELACAVGALGGLLWYYRTHSERAKRIWAVAGASLVCLFALVSRVNIYELLFHPDAHPVFAAVQQAKVDPDDKVIAVKVGGTARAYPIRTIAYHHLINDVVGREPIVATY